MRPGSSLDTPPPRVRRAESLRHSRAGWAVGAGKSQLFELGPGAQIKAMVKRIDPGAWGAFKNMAA